MGKRSDGAKKLICIDQEFLLLLIPADHNNWQTAGRVFQKFPDSLRILLVLKYRHFGRQFLYIVKIHLFTDPIHELWLTEADFCHLLLRRTAGRNTEKQQTAVFVFQTGFCKPDGSRHTGIDTAAVQQKLLQLLIVFHMQLISRAGTAKILRSFLHFGENFTVFISSPAVYDLHCCPEALLHFFKRGILIVQCHIQLEGRSVFQWFKFVLAGNRLIYLEFCIRKKLLYRFIFDIDHIQHFDQHIVRQLGMHIFIHQRTDQLRLITIKEIPPQLVMLIQICSHLRIQGLILQSQTIAASKH